MLVYVKEILKIIFIASKFNKINLILLIIFSFFIGILDILLSLSLSLMGVIYLNNELVVNNPLLNKIFIYTGLSLDNFILLIFILNVLFIIFIFIMGLLYRFYEGFNVKNYFINYYKLAYKKILTMPFSKLIFGINKNILFNLNSGISMVVEIIVMHSVILLSSLLFLTLVLILVFSIMPKLVLIIIVMIALYYLFVFRFLVAINRKIMTGILKLHSSLQMLNMNFFANPSEIKILNFEKNIYNRIYLLIRGLGNKMIKHNIVKNFDNLFLDLMIYFLVITIFLISKGKHNLESGVTVFYFSFVTLLFYRSLPKYKLIISSLSNICSNHYLFIDFLKLLKLKFNNSESRILSSNFDNSKNINLEKINSIKINNLSYVANKKVIINNINLDININDNKIIGFAGISGSGKTNLAYFLTGLLLASDNNIVINDKITINKDNYLDWRKKCLFIPQNTYTYKDTIFYNIVIDKKDSAKYDKELLERVVEIAQLKPLIETLPDGLFANLSKDSINLSAGQLQRIGIARYLYHKLPDAKMIILDEVTSNLDNIVQYNFLQSLIKYTPDILKVVISHNFDLLKQCQKIYCFKNGELIEQGSFDDLINLKKEFYKIYKVI